MRFGQTFVRTMRKNSQKVASAGWQWRRRRARRRVPGETAEPLRPTRSKTAVPPSFQKERDIAGTSRRAAEHRPQRQEDTNRKETNDEIPLLIKLPFAEGDIRRDSEAVGRAEQTTLTSGAGGPLMGSQVIAHDPKGWRRRLARPGQSGAH